MTGDGGWRRAGYVAVGLAAALWAYGGALASELIDRGASALELAEARAWISAVVLGAYLVVRRGRHRQPSRAPIGTLVVFGLGIALTNFFYYLALSLLPVAVAITVQYTAPGLVVVWTAAAWRRMPTRSVLVALGLAIVGVALLAELPQTVARGAAVLPVSGVAAALGAAVGFAMYMVTGERLSRSLGPSEALVRGFWIASVFWVVVQATRGRPDTLLDPAFVPWVVVLALFTTIAPFFLFLWGAERVGAQRASVTSTLEPLGAAVIAFFWLGEVLSLLQILGGIMVVVGIGIVQAERPQTEEVLAERAAVE